MLHSPPQAQRAVVTGDDTPDAALFEQVAARRRTVLSHQPNSRGLNTLRPQRDFESSGAGSQ
jgi:hypothetical protein